MLRMACVLLLILLQAHYEDANPSCTEMVRSHGYPVEQYDRIKTKDGYLLTVHRIPHGVKNRDRNNRPVAFLMHGLFCSSADWVNMGPGVSLAYDLADAGYDVWLGNARGTKMCKSHKVLNPSLNRKKFWDFSWHEIGYYDLPAMIDYVLKRTQRERLYYVGHSQGTTSFFVMACKRPKYNKKIKLMIALAPMVYNKNTWNPLLQLLSEGTRSTRVVENLLGTSEFTACDKLCNMLGQKLCDSKAAVKAMCRNDMFLVGGWDSEQFNKSCYSTIAANAPDGVSCKQLLHHAQGCKNGKFREYDYGRIENIVRYQSANPPAYKLNKVTCPVHLVYGDNDWLSAAADVEKLNSKLCKVMDVHRVQCKNFNHYDFLYAKNLKRVVNNYVVDCMNRFDD